MTDYQDTPDGATLLTKVAIGQELLGINNQVEAAKYRGVFIHDTQALLSPFREVGEYHDDAANTNYFAYELRKFIECAAYGEPEALQILYSDKIAFDTWAFNMLRKHRVLLLDSAAISNSYSQYATKMLAYAKGLKPFKITGAFAAEVFCTLMQGTELLQWGYMTTDIKGYPFDLHETVQRLRYKPTLTPDEFVTMVLKLKKNLRAAYNATGDTFSVDTVWLEDFINDIYVNQHGLTTRVRNGYPDDRRS